MLVNEESLAYPTYLIDFISYYYSENNDDNAAVQRLSLIIVF